MEESGGEKGEGAALVHPCLCQLCLLRSIFSLRSADGPTPKRREEEEESPELLTCCEFAGCVPIQR